MKKTGNIITLLILIATIFLVVFYLNSFDSQAEGVANQIKVIEDTEKKEQSYQDEIDKIDQEIASVYDGKNFDDIGLKDYEKAIKNGIETRLKDLSKKLEITEESEEVELLIKEWQTISEMYLVKSTIEKNIVDGQLLNKLDIPKDFEASFKALEDKVPSFYQRYLEAFKLITEGPKEIEIIANSEESKPSQQPKVEEPKIEEPPLVVDETKQNTKAEVTVPKVNPSPAPTPTPEPKLPIVIQKPSKNTGSTSATQSRSSTQTTGQAPKPKPAQPVQPAPAEETPKQEPTSPDSNKVDNPPVEEPVKEKPGNNEEVEAPVKIEE